MLQAFPPYFQRVPLHRCGYSFCTQFRYHLDWQFHLGPLPELCSPLVIRRSHSHVRRALDSTDHSTLQHLSRGLRPLLLAAVGEVNLDRNCGASVRMVRRLCPFLCCFALRCSFALLCSCFALALLLLCFAFALLCFVFCFAFSASDHP